MHKYITTGVASFGADMLLGLSKEQAAARSFALIEEKGGYRPTQVIQFKAGEAISIDRAFETLPGTLRSVLEPVAPKAAKATKAAGKPAGGDVAEKDGRGPAA